MGVTDEDPTSLRYSVFVRSHLHTVTRVVELRLLGSLTKLARCPSEPRSSQWSSLHARARRSEPGLRARRAQVIVPSPIDRRRDEGLNAIGFAGKLARHSGQETRRALERFGWLGFVRD